MMRRSNLDEGVAYIKSNLGRLNLGEGPLVVRVQIVHGQRVLQEHEFSAPRAGVFDVHVKVDLGDCSQAKR